VSDTSFELEWRDVKEGSQVWVNNYTWLVEHHVAGQVSMYSPALDKRHVGNPKPWVKVTVLLPGDKRYRQDWSEKFIEVLAESDEVDGALYREMLLVVRLGGRLIGEKPDGQPWKCWEMDRMDVSHMRLHFVYFHRVDAAGMEDNDLVALHRIEHERGQYSIEHEHGGIR